MEYISVLSYYAGYKMVNLNNLFNFMLIVMSKLTNEEKKKFVDDMVLLMGRSFTKDFKNYIFDKMPKSDLLEFF